MASDAGAAHLDLLKKCLTYSLWGETVKPFDWSVLSAFHRAKYALLARFLARRNLRIDLLVPYHLYPKLSRSGYVWTGIYWQRAEP